MIFTHFLEVSHQQMLCAVLFIVTGLMCLSMQTLTKEELKKDFIEN